MGLLLSLNFNRRHSPFYRYQCGNTGDRVQLYMMEGMDREIGKIGLLEWLDPKLPDPGPPTHQLGIGDVVLVADVPDMDSFVARVGAFPGATVFSPPRMAPFRTPTGKE